ncbi:hypothetical protein, partial [Pseudomonas viridiflava]|uniref:hypothetical protein n=1 Tax=Pseudomonas viridiflava TaxID=33069 RepID=UPI00197D0939
REKAGTSDADAVAEILHSRTSPHGPVFAVRQRYVEDVVAPPTEFAARQRYVEDVVAPPTKGNTKTL